MPEYTYLDAPLPLNPAALVDPEVKVPPGALEATFGPDVAEQIKTFISENKLPLIVIGAGAGLMMIGAILK